MSRVAAFDNERYLETQCEAILERAATVSGTLYLEFGGKLVSDQHAARVLPGYDPNVKMALLKQLSDRAEVILCVYAGHIEQRKVRADFGITYDADAFKLIDDIRAWGLDVATVVITRFEGQPAAMAFKAKVERIGIRCVLHGPIRGYPGDVDLILSERGYGGNPYIPVSRPLVVVTGPGPGSGKMATCLSQIYHEHQEGKVSGFAKFETFPVWDLPLRHPVNVAYEAATADMQDMNMIDPFHLEAYNVAAVNYNRDVETFPVLRSILERIGGDCMDYRSPTDMGVNRVGKAILDDAGVRSAACQEIIRRQFRYACEQAMGLVDVRTVDRISVLMKQVGAKPEDRAVVAAARDAASRACDDASKGNENILCGAALALPDAGIVTGVNSGLLHAASSLILNAAKTLGGIPDHLHLLSPNIIQSIARLKQKTLGQRTVSLDVAETLIALSIASTTNPTAELAMAQLKQLRGCDLHMTHMPTPGDETGLRRLGVNVTCDPHFGAGTLYSI